MDYSDRYAFVDFAVTSESGLARLERVVAELAKQKTGEALRGDDFWLQYFTECDRKKFWWPSAAQLELWNEFWFSTPLPQRHSSEMPAPSWGFGSMIDAILDGEYQMVGIRKFDAETARLEIDPYAYPYGGMDALRMLVRSFGHMVTGFDDGTGFMSGDPQSPPWNEDMPPFMPKRPSLWDRLKRR